MNAPVTISDEVARFLAGRLNAPEGWSAATAEFNGVIQGGVIVVRDEKVFERVVTLVNDRCRKGQQ
jgi:hypothetical protein